MHSTKSKKTQKVNQKEDFPQFVFSAIGTHWVIDLYHSLSIEKQQELLSKIQTRIEQFDKTYSRFRNDSLVAEISRNPGTYTFPDDFSEMISLYKKIYALTDGLVTPLIGNVLEDAGYDKDYSLQLKTLHPPHNWEDVLIIDQNTLTTTQPITLDFGAIGKGYLIDIIGKLLIEENIHSFCIDAGGDILIKNKPLQIGFEHPQDQNMVVGVLDIENGSLCASAGNRRKWQNFHHIINPKTLTPVSDILAVWVGARDAKTADALTTALFFVEPSQLQKDFAFEYLIIYNDYTYINSQLFPSQLFIN